MLRKPLSIAFIGLAVLPLAACGSVEARGDESSGRTITGYGLSIELPAGWDGRVFKGEPQAAAQVIAANFPLPA